MYLCGRRYSNVIRQFLSLSDTVDTPVEMFIEVRLILRQYLQHKLRISLCNHISEAKDEIELRARLKMSKKKIAKEKEKAKEKAKEDKSKVVDADAPDGDDIAFAAAASV